MKITKKNTKGLKREFSIVISAKEIEDKINEKLSEIALTARIQDLDQARYQLQF